jgi:hypothetical protein
MHDIWFVGYVYNSRNDHVVRPARRKFRLPRPACAVPMTTARTRAITVQDVPGTVIWQVNVVDSGTVGMTSYVPSEPSRLPSEVEFGCAPGRSCLTARRR